MASKNVEKPVELGGRVKGVIELKQVDIKPYIGKVTTIESVKEFEGEFGFYVKAETAVIATLDIKDKNGKPIELRATRIFGLHEDDEGNLGWAKGTKLGDYLDTKKVSHYNDLVGKEVICQVQTSKDNREFLSFL